MQPPHPPKPTGYIRWAVVLFFVGTAIHLWLLSRSWIGEDQVHLLSLGQDFATTHTLSPMGKGMSGGGTIPGSGLQLLVGVPLMFWQDYRAPLVLIGIFSLFSGLILLRLLKEWGDPLFGVIFFGLYWLSPWRLYHSSLLWEPAFLFLPTALAFWASFRLRATRSMWPSVVLGAMLSFTPQIHGSFLWLWILTAMLIWKKQIFVDWRGIAVGVLAGALSFLPAVFAILGPGLRSSSLPSGNIIGTGFLLVYPILKGALYWLRMPSLDLGDPLKEMVYFADWAKTGFQTATVGALRIMQWASTATIGVVVCCYWNYWTNRKKAKQTGVKLTYNWLERYAGYSLFAMLIAAGLAPITLQSWHVVIALHAALLPLALWFRRHYALKKYGRRLLAGYLAFGVAIIIAVGFGKPSFRKISLPSQAKQSPSIRQLLPAGMGFQPEPNSIDH